MWCRPDRDPDEHLNLSRLTAIYSELIVLCLILAMALILFSAGACCAGGTVFPQIVQHLNTAGKLPRMDPAGHICRHRSPPHSSKWHQKS